MTARSSVLAEIPKVTDWYRTQCALHCRARRRFPWPRPAEHTRACQARGVYADLFIDAARSLELHNSDETDKLLELIREQQFVVAALTMWEPTL